ASHWAHRVAAATGADPDLAADLDDAAARAADRGHHLLAARYSRWAADLCTVRADHERRLLLSGVHAACGPDRAAARALLPEVERCAESALRSLTAGLIALFGTGDWLAARRHFSAALDRSRGSGDWVEAVAAAGLSGAQVWSGRGREALEHTRHALRLGGLPVRLADFTTVLLAVARCRVDGMAGGLSELDDLPADPAEVPPDRLDSLACRGAIRTMLGRFTAAEHDLTTTIRHHGAGCHLMSGTTPHSYLAALHYARGEWDRASVLVHQALSLADDDEQPHHRALRHMVATLVPAGRGDWATATAHVKAARGSAERAAGPQDRKYAAIAAATLHQARGLPAEMLTALHPLTGDDPDGTHVWWHLWWRPLLVEALLGTGRRDEAAEHLAALRTHATEYLRPTLLRFELALTPERVPTGTKARVAELARRAHPHSFAQALLEADLGTRLAGEGATTAAAPFLRSALNRFTALRATPFEHRVRRHLGGDREPAASPLAGLSRREGQIAHLVSLDHTNREVAAQLYITTKTVEYHLHNIYSKLGVAGRRQLRERVAAAGAAPPAHLSARGTGA
ncbi:helix-turn-helix domain-containing protein, partial [Actinokineospora spheciospongiae]|uniref:helix-turn-helix domain-containing protein n=1 Tax=Actinokineospora spheciospongiae TaxID=909613 RepID=UPI00054D9DAA